MRTVIMIILGWVFMVNAQDSPQVESELENLQILPFTKKSEVKDFMKAMARNVGKKCRDCHDLDHKASDEKENKRTARRMMRMVGEINGKLLPEDAEHKVTCWTCHRGEKHPEEHKD